MGATDTRPKIEGRHGKTLTYLLCTVSLVASITLSAMAAGAPQEALIAEGVALHDKGDFEGAAAKYRQALAENPSNDSALYELGVTLLSAGKWVECVEVGKRGQKLGTELAPSFVAIAGSCLDSLDEPRKAEKMFRKGLKEFGPHGPLSFNLGVTLMKRQKPAEAKVSFQDALRYRSTHPSSTFYLGVAYDNLGSRASAILAYLRFLTLEPSSQRSHAAANAVFELMHQGVDAESPENVTINIFSQAQNEDDPEEKAAGLMLSMLSAGRFLETNEGKSEATLSAEILPSLVSYMEEVSPADRRDDFLWEVLLPPLSDLKQRELLESLGYLALSLLETPGAQEWVDNNQPAVIELEQWMRTVSLAEE